MALRARIEGLDRLRRKLDTMEPRIARAMSEAISQNAAEMAQQSARLAPRDTGDLAETIGWMWTPSRNVSEATRASIKGGVRLSADVHAGIRGGKGFHAGFVEFGTVDQSPQPFFYPVYRLNRRRYRSRISRAINKAVKALQGA
jgi:HK97 gp10 family phage protein